MKPILIALSLLLLFSQGQAQQPAPLPERFTALGISLGDGLTQSGTAQLELTIDRWSTAEELAALFEAGARGQQALADAMYDTPSDGSLATPLSVPYPLHSAVQRIGEEDTRHISLATPPPMSYWELVRRSRSVAYPTTFIELRVDEEGRGAG